MNEKIYNIKECFLTIQCEGFHQGKTAIFCRFSDCNLWNGENINKNNSICNFCDTEIKGTDGFNGGQYNLSQLLKVITDLWKDPYNKPFIVLTGGEPSLQINQILIDKLKENGFYIAIETNGTKKLPYNIDWIACSPKTKNIYLTKVDELKIVYPSVNPLIYDHIEATHYWIQPNSFIVDILEKSLLFCFKHSEWKLSLQPQRYINLDVKCQNL